MNSTNAFLWVGVCVCVCQSKKIHITILFKCKIQHWIRKLSYMPAENNFMKHLGFNKIETGRSTYPVLECIPLVYWMSIAFIIMQKLKPKFISIEAYLEIYAFMYSIECANVFQLQCIINYSNPKHVCEWNLAYTHTYGCSARICTICG